MYSAATSSSVTTMRPGVINGAADSDLLSAIELISPSESSRCQGRRDYWEQPADDRSEFLPDQSKESRPYILRLPSFPDRLFCTAQSRTAGQDCPSTLTASRKSGTS